MALIKFLIDNWDSVLLVLAAIASVIVLIKRGETQILKEILFGLVTRAEKEFGEGTGSLKYANVADWIYQRIPTALKVLFTSNDIEKMIEDVLKQAKAKWEKNQNLQNYVAKPAELTAEDVQKAVSVIAENAAKEVSKS